MTDIRAIVIDTLEECKQSFAFLTTPRAKPKPKSINKFKYGKNSTKRIEAPLLCVVQEPNNTQ